jgi:hypothetical protein
MFQYEEERPHVGLYFVCMGYVTVLFALEQESKSLTFLGEEVKVVLHGALVGADKIAELIAIDVF